MNVEGGVNLWKNTMIFDPIDRIWIFGWFSTFCPLRDSFTYHILSVGLENDLFCFLKIPGLYLLQDGYIYIHVYTHRYACLVPRGERSCRTLRTMSARQEHRSFLAVIACKAE